MYLICCFFFKILSFNSEYEHTQFKLISSKKHRTVMRYLHYAGSYHDSEYQPTFYLCIHVPKKNTKNNR